MRSGDQHNVRDDLLARCCPFQDSSRDPRIATGRATRACPVMARSAAHNSSVQSVMARSAVHNSSVQLWPAPLITTVQFSYGPLRCSQQFSSVSQSVMARYGPLASTGWPWGHIRGSVAVSFRKHAFARYRYRPLPLSARYVISRYPALSVITAQPVQLRQPPATVQPRFRRLPAGLRVGPGISCLDRTLARRGWGTLARSIKRQRSAYEMTLLRR
eukprot:gene17457-biopygen5130